MGRITAYGYNADVDTSEESVWVAGSTYNWKASAGALKVSSSSANDTSAGTGARTIVISGLDTNYAEISETVTLAGTTQATTTAEFLRVNSVYAATAGSGGENAGVIYVYTGTATAGVPDSATTVLGHIAAGKNRTAQAIYTVPAGHQLRVDKVYFFTGSNGTDYITFRVKSRPFGGVFEERYQANVFRSGMVMSGTRINPLFIFEAKTDIDLRAIGTGSGNLDATAVLTGEVVRTFSLT